jgi:hypothetical protein
MGWKVREALKCVALAMGGICNEAGQILMRKGGRDNLAEPNVWKWCGRPHSAQRIKSEREMERVRD